MSYLGRDGAPFSAKLWSSIDDAVVITARTVLTARRFLSCLRVKCPDAIVIIK